MLHDGVDGVEMAPKQSLDMFLRAHLAEGPQLDAARGICKENFVETAL
jgi:hypothetical protein